MKTRLRKVPASSLNKGQACFIPADKLSADEINEAKIRIDSVVNATITKPRSVAMNRKAHAFGKLLARNIESFKGLDAHAAFKRVQLESGIECDTLILNLEGVTVPYRIARSIAFDKMDENAFDKLLFACADYVATKYYNESTTASEVFEMIGELLNE